jgi:hypothetical protein
MLILEKSDVMVAVRTGTSITGRRTAAYCNAVSTNENWNFVLNVLIFHVKR